MVSASAGTAIADVTVDHLIIACAALETGIDWFATLTGVRPASGGNHPGRGTRNALVGAGPGVYVELLAPDPGQELAGTFGASLVPLPAPTLFGYMLRTASIASAREVYARHGIRAEAIDATRTLPDGRTLAWELLIPASTVWGLVLPNFIDWQGSPHPSDAAPAGCRLGGLRAEHQDALALAPLWRSLGVPFELAVGPSPRLAATLATPFGERVIG